MAIQIIDSGNNIHRTANVVAASSDYTCIFWVNLINFIAAYNIFVTANGTPGVNVYTKYVEIYGNALGLNGFNIDITDGTTDDNIDGGNIVTNLWGQLGYTRSGNIHSFYINGVLINTANLDISANGFNFILLGDDGTNDGNTQQFWNFREWNVALTGAQILTEINSPNAVVHTSGLVTYTPLTSDLLDISGNGNNWTQVGSVSFVADPLPPSVGTLFIPSDHFDSVKAGAVIIDGTTGALLTSLPFVTADQGGRLASGIWALAAQVSSSSGNVNAVNVYDTSFNLVGSVSIASWFSPPFCASKSFFYIQNPSSPFTVEQITSSGILSGSSWALSGKADAIAVTDDDSVLYWKDGLTIHAFDLVNNIALPDVLVLSLGDQVQDQIIVVNGTDFIITYTNSGLFPDWTIERYNSSGVLQKTYGPVTNAGDYDSPEIFVDYNLSYFWMRAFDTDTDTSSTWYKFSISTGSVVTTFTTPDMDGGGTVPTTCPVIPMGSSPTATIIIGKAIPAGGSQTFTVNAPGLVPSTFTIGIDGAQEFDNVAPGTYSITEVADPNYNPEYLISNDPVNNDNLAIVVNNGDNIAVVIVNHLSTKFGGLYQLVPDKTNDTVKNQDGTNIDLMINWFWQLFIARDK